MTPARRGLDPARRDPALASISLVLAGSGGAGAISAATMLLEAAGRAHWYGYMTRSVGAQIRGGEAAAMLRFGVEPIGSHDDRFQVLLALDWQNLGKFASEMPLSPDSVIIGDPEQGPVPDPIAASGARLVELPLKKTAQGIPGGRPNMVALGVLGGMIGLSFEQLAEVVDKAVAAKGEKALAASRAAVQAGLDAAAGLGSEFRLAAGRPPQSVGRWNMTGNEATGAGAIRGGVRFVAAYPITPATEVLEWLAPSLGSVGGTLIQVEDELAAINQIIGASFGGVPSLTATAGPGLALMTESLGLAVASETPVVVVDVMRGGPSTGIPGKSEQSDLNIALYGLHGDAPHLVLAPNSVADCLLTTQWAVHLAETLQTPALVLSDQSLGQSRAVIDRPPEVVFATRREVATALAEGEKYLRYAPTPSGVSPMAIPGTPGCQYTADGLEHTAAGTPSSQADDHVVQLTKRARKLDAFDYGDYWMDVEGDGDVAIVTWGSSTGAAREAMRRWQGRAKLRLLGIRLLSPVQPEKFAAALAGVSRALVVEQSFGAQFYRYLRAHYDLPRPCKVLNRPGPLPFRPHEIIAQLADMERSS
jgi:2-oxoglutarate/2-oxoacid ferredoxin oxidoreductase subunit alpha